MPEEIMDANEVAKYLGISKATVYKWVEYRQIPFTKVGTLLRFPKWLIDQHLAKNSTRPDEFLYEEFERLYSRFFLEKFLKSQGLDPRLMTDEQILEELRQALPKIRKDSDVPVSDPKQQS